MCSLSPHPQRLLLSNCGGGASPSSHRSSSYLQKTALLVSQWVREGGEGRGVGGDAQQPVMPQLPITCLSPTQPSSREALFYQRHSLKHISATPNLSAFRSPLCPFRVSASFPESSPLPALPACHPSVLMRGRDQRGRPLEFDRATCCASAFLPPRLALSCSSPLPP